MKLIALICALVPFLLPLHNVSNGVYYVLTLYYFFVVMIAYVAIMEGNKWTY